MQEKELQERVLRHVTAPDYQPVKPRVIAKQLDLPEEQHRELRKAIKKLVKKGKLAFGDQHLVLPLNWVPPKGDRSFVTGQFQRTAKGFGFVRPHGTARTEGRGQDIFIPLSKTGDAATGDVVKVRLRPQRQGDDRLSGVIVEVLERETSQFVGVYLERGGEAFVQVDGTLFAEPIAVGDPGAKNALEGDKVVIEMVRFPTPLHAGEAVIAEVLGARNAPGVDTLSIIREFDLPERFSPDIQDAARAQADQFDESIGDRLDLTGATIITIDPQDARDFDDAISLEKLDNGHWRLGVHIADVSHFVPHRSPLDVEARERATSVYLPDRVIPMLPELISNGLASLQPGKVRYTKTVFIEFTPEGARVATEFHNSAMQSKRRFTYEEVDEFLLHPHRWETKLTSGVFALLLSMRELAMLLRQRRLTRGAIELTLPEIKIDLDKKGRVAGAHVLHNTVSHQIIEEFMLAANEAVAEHLNDRGLNFLRRIHEPPNPRKLEALTSFVRELGIECESLGSRFEIKRVVELAAGRPEQHAVHYAVLRSLQKAVYGPQAEGHFALNSDHYCHFTSPIRRYPDLVIHRMFDSLARGQRPADDFEQLASLGEHCSDREQRAEAAERQLIKVKLLLYLSTRIGEQMAAVITGVEEYGLFAQGIELPAEGLIRVEALADDNYRFDRQTHSLTGYRQGNSYRLGDLVQVEIAHVDVSRRELDFRLLWRLKKTDGKTTRTGPAESSPTKPRSQRAKTPPRPQRRKRG
ncbi:MAG: ribonuclease R [Planctomycetota bacterium]|nr:ribonuclease R [Planctomycetota bacterium]